VRTPLACALALLAITGTAGVVAVNRAEGSPVHSHRATAPAVLPTPIPTVTAAHAPVPAPVRRPPITVNGRPVRITGRATVGRVVHAAGIRIRPGRYLSVVQHHRLRSNGQPGGASVNGHRATLRTPVHPGDSVVVHQGPSRLEPTERVTVRLQPAVPSALYVGGRAGLARVRRGTISHEVVATHVLRRPRIGHLVEPGAVALTFDDGPSRHWTRTIAALLHRHQAPATFCMIGRQVREFATVVRRLVRWGNALCDHTWDHNLDLRDRPAAQQRRDIRRGYHAIVRNGGVRPQFFRAPGGVWSPSLKRLGRAEGMRPLEWTVDPQDWARPGVHRIVRGVLTELRPGGVILLHDGGGRRRQTLDALTILLRRLPKLGYHFVLPPARHVAA
jgi:peptidoglycan/xylan/chitin deacetylase (PgdA/CDA1 family)